jgi:hypothetical protein
MGLDDELARITERQEAVKDILDAPVLAKIILIIASIAEDSEDYLEYKKVITDIRSDARFTSDYSYTVHSLGHLTSGEAAYLAAKYIAFQCDPGYEDDE